MVNYVTSVGVQQFTVSLTTAQASNTATINAVGSGAFILFDGQNPSGNTSPSNDYFRITLTNSTTITATRNAASGAATVSGVIVDGDTANLIKSVQYGTINISVSSGTATISPITNTNAAVHYLGHSSVNTSYIATSEEVALSLSGTTVTATRAGTTGALVVGFVVIEFQGTALNSNVQNISASSSASVTSYTAVVSSVTLAKTLCIFSGSTNAAASANMAISKQYGSLTSGTQLTVNVNTGAANAKTYKCCIVEFVSGVLNSNIQRGTTTLGAVISNSTTLGTNVNLSYSGVNWLGNQASATTGRLDESEGSTSLIPASNVTQVGGVNFSGTSPKVISGIAPSAGNALVVAIASAGGSGVTVTGVTDNKSQTWIQVPSARATDSTSGSFTDIWYFPNTTSGVTSITITFSSAVAMEGEYYELTNISPSSSIDTAVARNNVASSATAVTGALTTTSPGDFLIAITSQAATQAPLTAVAPFILSIFTSFYGPGTIITGQTATLTYTTASAYCASMAAFFSTGIVDKVVVTKNTAATNIIGSWEVFEFTPFVSPPSGNSYIFIGGFI